MANRDSAARDMIVDGAAGADSRVGGRVEPKVAMSHVKLVLSAINAKLTQRI